MRYAKTTYTLTKSTLTGSAPTWMTLSNTSWGKLSVILSKRHERSTAYFGTGIQPVTKPVGKPKVYPTTSSDYTGTNNVVIETAHYETRGLRLRKEEQMKGSYRRKRRNTKKDVYSSGRDSENTRRAAKSMVDGKEMTNHRPGDKAKAKSFAPWIQGKTNYRQQLNWGKTCVRQDKYRIRRPWKWRVLAYRADVRSITGSEGRGTDVYLHRSPRNNKFRLSEPMTILILA